MWTQNWHRFLQGIYGACKAVYDYSSTHAIVHDTDAAGTEPRYHGYYYNRGLKWIDVVTCNANALTTPASALVANSQLDFDLSTIEYATNNISEYYYGFKPAVVQLGNGQASDDYTAYDLASPITSGFAVQNVIQGTTYDAEENKHKKTATISIVNNSSTDISVSEFGLFLQTTISYSFGASPALCYYEKFSPVNIPAGGIFRLTIEQEMPILEVDTQ
ncbi:MAG: hypothetical protein IKS76_01620 [Paludibacteraceae bacterium]|nr:hypothetical protein [Paludibacteraceae bacterium]